MAGDSQSTQRKLMYRTLSVLVAFYCSYREWRKNRGRAKRSRKRFRRMLAFYSYFIKEGDLTFDIGANIGSRTEIFLKLGAAVVAVEPQQSCVVVLKDKFANCKDVHIVAKALDKEVGNKEIFISPNPVLSSMSEDWIKSVKQSGRFVQEYVWDIKETVETTTLDHLIKEYGRPSFCKIDTEGFEYNVLRGLSEPVNAMSFEFHPEFIQCAVDCVRYLSKLGKAKFNYSEGESMSLALSAWVEPDEIINTLTSLPKDGKIFGDVYARFSKV